MYMFQFIPAHVWDFNEKVYFPHISVWLKLLKSVRDFSLLLFPICKRQFFVSGQLFSTKAP